MNIQKLIDILAAHEHRGSVFLSLDELRRLNEPGVDIYNVEPFVMMPTRIHEDDLPGTITGRWTANKPHFKILNRETKNVRNKFRKKTK